MRILYVYKSILEVKGELYEYGMAGYEVNKLRNTVKTDELELHFACQDEILRGRFRGAKFDEVLVFGGVGEEARFIALSNKLLR